MTPISNNATATWKKSVHGVQMAEPYAGRGLEPHSLYCASLCTSVHISCQSNHHH